MRGDITGVVDEVIVVGFIESEDLDVWVAPIWVKGDGVSTFFGTVWHNGEYFTLISQAI